MTEAGPTSPGCARSHADSLFTLARHHGWSRAIPESTLLNWALEDSNRERGRRAVEALSNEPSITGHPFRGYRIKNDPDAQAAVAARLLRDCEYTTLQVEATLSRFEAAGGVDAYDLEAIADSPGVVAQTG